LSSPAAARTYSTAFPNTENPISEGGNWINGKTDGNDWADIRTTPAYAFGTESGITGYDDSTALLAGNWGSDQTAQATVHAVNPQSNDSIWTEVEIRLRSSISTNPNRCTGYEVCCELAPHNFIAIVSWNGALGDWTTIGYVPGGGTIHDGDVIKASITGNVITVWVNGVNLGQVTDSGNRWTSGKPGMGFYLQGTTGINHDYGFTSFMATDGLPSPPAGSPVYPLKKSANGRHLVDQSNAPCLLIGESPQALTVNLTTNEADLFFTNRGAHGFNTAWVNLLCATYTGGRSDASTIDGILPFTGNVPSTSTYDMTKPNEAFFARVDQMINLAAQQGIQVLLDPGETGSFLSVMLDNGTNRCRAYGQFLGNRYKNFPNIIWMSGNDFQSWRTPGDDAVVRAVALGIQDTDTNHLQTAELDYLVSSSLDDANWNSILGLNGTYTYYPTYARLQQDYNRANFLPSFVVEANYEFESLQGPVTTAPILRKQEYWTMTSGACGQMYGNHYTWPFLSGWQSYLDTPGAIEIGHLKAFFKTRAWYNLVPDTNHVVVTTGYGTYSDTGHVVDNDYLTDARTPDGSLVVVYTPIIRTFTVDMSQLGGPASAQWFDPAGGIYYPVSGSPFTNSGTHNFTPPANNADGDGGWVLVMETGAPSSPGSLSGSGAAGGTSAVDLTAEGTEDWAHWGFSGTNIDHKSVFGSEVNHIIETHVGSPLQYTNNANGYSWSDGTPTVNAVATTTGIYIINTGNSFTLTVLADTTSRTLKLYVGGWMSAGTLTAHLPDGSAADYTDSSFSNLTASYYAVYTITYHAGAANQNLTIRWQMASGPAGGNVTLQAATLQGGGSAEVIRFVPAWMSVGSTGCSLSWSGSTSATNNFKMYRSTNLTVAGWQLVAPSIARSGTGTNLWTDTNVFPRAFYRVAVPAQ
jgi:hypothetical protein